MYINIHTHHQHSAPPVPPHPTSFLQPPTRDHHLQRDVTILKSQFSMPNIHKFKSLENTSPLILFFLLLRISRRGSFLATQILYTHIIYKFEALQTIESLESCLRNCLKILEKAAPEMFYIEN